MVTTWWPKPSEATKLSASRTVHLLKSTSDSDFHCRHTRALNLLILRIAVAACASFVRRDKAARYGIQSITLVAIAGGVLEYGTANASWDVSRRLTKGHPYIGNFHRHQKLSRVSETLTSFCSTHSLNPPIPHTPPTHPPNHPIPRSNIHPVGLRVGFININDMYNNDVGKGGAQGCEAYEVK